MASHSTESIGSFGILGNSDPIKGVRNFVKKVSSANANILILGESGVGKELVARAIHCNSLRKNQPFMAVNCAAIAENLVESELFGHEKGAFTGAFKAKPGYFERAQGGTLFLDEIGELPVTFQAKLLRAIQERQIERIGSTTTIKLDVRIISATNQDLEKGIHENWFRKDLYYRINVISITIAPLRNRLSDIPILANHFLGRYQPRGFHQPPQLSPKCLKALQNYDYPGNVRELENIIHRAVVLAGYEPIQLSHLPDNVIAALNHSNPALLKSEIRTDPLFKSLKKIMIETKQGQKRYWHECLRCITIEQIHHFLVDQACAWFSRKSLEDHLKKCAGSDISKYKTAGVYLKIMTTHNICMQNGEKANRSAYKLHDRFISKT